MPDSCTFCSCSYPFRPTISCTTDSVLSCNHVIWKITNFSFIIVEKGEYISSPKFATGTSNRTEWTLHLYPNGHRYDGEIGIFLFNESKADAVVNCSFSILNERKEKCHSKNAGKSRVKMNLDWGFSRLVSRETICKPENGFLPNDTLTLLCEMEVVDDCIESSVYRVNNSLEKLSQDFLRLFKNKELSDVTISIGEDKYLVHKNVLSVRSPVFAANFKHEMLENKTNVIEINDIEARVMEQALIYMYSGDCPGIKEMASELVAVAEKYDIEGLKSLCEHTLSEELTSENAAKTLIAADLYNLKKLRVDTMDFICKHIKEIFHTEGWKDMTQSHPHLELEVLRTAVHQNTILISSGNHSVAT